MILQHFLFPSQDFNPAITAFFRPSKAIAYSLGEQQIVFPCAEQVDFDTYFNAFTPSKWVKYTSIKDASFRLHLKGAFIISLYF